ncbi:hypothetical protein [Arthrobacter sp. Leaf234]|uniref:hypothetical protein n=1 Tax=Arthrobacter sp. Leaf234 TaxID=1736303 RepID=UPI000B024BD0|nr:hypothetical protein [Arthrobacter sp. Leaf234]
MNTEPSKPSTRRTRGVALGAIAAGVALTGSLALTGVTPSSAYEAVFAAQNQPAKVVAAETPSPARTPSPAASRNPDSPADAGAGSASSDAAKKKASAMNEGVGVVPPKPKADDAELGRTPQKKNKPVKMTDKVQVLDGLTVSVAGLAAVQGVADEPGEVAGDAVKVSVTLSNTSAEAVDTSGVLVDMEAGPDAVPGLALRGSGATTLPASIEPGASATADYVFVVESNKRARVSVLVNYSVSAPVAVFEGTAPPAKGKK